MNLSSNQRLFHRKWNNWIFVCSNRLVSCRDFSLFCFYLILSCWLMQWHMMHFRDSGIFRLRDCLCGIVSAGTPVCEKNKSIAGVGVGRQEEPRRPSTGGQLQLRPHKNKPNKKQRSEERREAAGGTRGSWKNKNKNLERKQEVASAFGVCPLVMWQRQH